VIAGAGEDLGAPGVHHHAAVRFLVVADAHHVDRAFHSEELAGQSQGAAPLSGPRLGGQPLDAGALVVVGLRHGGVGLMAAGRAGAFVLVIDMRRGVERLFETARAVERRGPPEPVDVHHLARNVDLRLGREFLLDQLHREDGSQVLRRQRARVWGFSGGASGSGSDGSTLTQIAGIWLSASKNLECSCMGNAYLTTSAHRRASR